jgi:hypothetical protein
VSDWCIMLESLNFGGKGCPTLPKKWLASRWLPS